jgi:hypothetical protein
VDVTKSSIPGVPEATQEWEDYDGWTAGAARAGIEAIATATDENPKELLEVAIDSAKRSIIGKEQVERDLEQMSRERLLPDERILEKVARYEAHLSRGLYKALHELGALQVRCTGGAARSSNPRAAGPISTPASRAIRGSEMGVRSLRSPPTTPSNRSNPPTTAKDT